MELFPAFERSVASTAEIVTMTPKDQLGAPTPCTEWDVRALLNHLTGTLWLAAALFGDQAPEVRSSAIMPLGEFGILAIGSSDPDHFQPGMGTLFLKMIAATVTAALRRSQEGV